jgi:cyclopropane fatty-acyl-phospholipid synthase-like methyltransferase
MFKLLGEQLRKPSGILGKLVAKMMDKRNKKYYLEIIDLLQLKKGDKILEIGYGPGQGIQMLAESEDDISIYGVDFSELMFKHASKRNKTYIANQKVKLQYGDLLSSDFINEKYDKIFCVNVIYFWDDLSQVFQKLLSMLNNRALFCIYMTSDEEFQNLSFANDFCKYSIETVETELKNAGFSHVDYYYKSGYFITASK